MRLGNQQERGVDNSTPMFAALRGKKVALVAEVPQGEFVWHRLKHYVEQQGIAPPTRGNCKEPSRDRPTFAIFLWSNYAPNFKGTEGAARRSAVVQLTTRYGAQASEEDDIQVDDNSLKYSIINGDFVQEQFWAGVCWLEALRMHSTMIPKPYLVEQWSDAVAGNQLTEWARQKFEPCTLNEAAAQGIVKKVVAEQLGMGQRDPNLAVQMRSATFSLDCRAKGNKGLVCKLVFAAGENPKYIRIR